MIETVVSQIAHNPSVVVVGARRSGKSSLALNVTSALGQRSILSRPADWRRDLSVSPGPNDETRVADEEVSESLARLASVGPEAVWVIDDFDAFIAQSSPTGLSQLRDAVQRRDFRVVAIRNIFVAEKSGWYARREASCLPNSETLRIPRLSLDEAAQLADRLVGTGIARDLRTAWLVRWAGGSPGLAFDLAPYVPQTWPTNTEFPAGIKGFVERTIADLNLTRPTRLLAMRGLRDLVLPSVATLPDHLALEVGYLISIGMIERDYVDLREPFTSRFWSTVARQATEFSINGVDRSSAIVVAHRVARVFDECGIADSAERALGGSSGLAELLHRIIVWHEREPQHSIPLIDVLADAVGGLGLRRALAITGGQGDGSDAPRFLAGRLIEALEK